METRRLILLMIFSFSLIMLWDNYQKSIGNPTLFGMPTGSAKAPEQEANSQASNSATTGAPGANSNEVPTPSVSLAAPDAKLPSGQAASVVGAVAQVVANPSAHPVKLIDISTNVLKLNISTEGGQLVSAELLNHPVSANNPKSVQLFESSANRTYIAQLGLIGLNDAPTHRTHFEVIQALSTPLKVGTGQLVLRAATGGVELTHTYTFYADQYKVDLNTTVKNLNDSVIQPKFYAQITRDAKPLPTDSKLYATFTGPALYTPEGKYQKISFDNIAKGKAEFIKTSNSGWFGMVQHYFVSAIIGPDGPRENFVRQIDPAQQLYAIGQISPLGQIAANASVNHQATIYTGPQNQEALAAIAPGLELVVDYGWLTIIAKPLFWLLQLIHSAVGNWGWSIVLLTLLVKLVFFPLSAASYKSMAKMRVVAPRMQRLKEQYANDRMGFQRAMMELYQREKISPLGGCMPVLVQIPVFIALYWVLLGSVEMRNAPWYWITDLAAPDDLLTRFLPFSLGVQIGILPILMAVTMFVQAKLNPTPPDPLQAKIMMYMPLVFSVMFVFFPAGLVLYWVVNNILSIAQQWYITRQLESAKAQIKPAESKPPKT